MNSRTQKNQIRARRTKRTRARIFGTASAPRLSVFRSNRLSYAQLIDDDKGSTLAAVSAKDLSAADRKRPKVAQAHALGELLAEKARAAGIARAVFDRGAYRYHGRVKAIAEGARKGGLIL
ncbi:MAG: 50S ribosomal protein L18 [Candidatus Liptonbacteria bacterium]|nr:50S ribosomal protein L18 [Candidatus Liptonbacteria bacterium]